MNPNYGQPPPGGYQMYSVQPGMNPQYGQQPMAYAQAVNFPGQAAPVPGGYGAPGAGMYPQAEAHAINLRPHEAIHEGQARAYLQSLKWPQGLQDTFVNNAYKVPFRVFICDDSGSMDANDGSRLIDMNGDSYGNRKLIQCSRWAELTDTMRFHANLAQQASTPTEFRLLNYGQPIIIGNTVPQDTNNLSMLLSYFQHSPSNGTPLCRHIREVTAEIRNMEHHLRSTGQKALLVIATDGEASDGNVAEAMRPLKSLPVWVVVRLCTSEANIVDYWNNVDKELELDMDVLDDLCGEAESIGQYAPWLTYGEPLHRLREFGCSVKELDLLDEKKLSTEQARRLCSVVYGGTEDSFPHPEADWNAFINTITSRNKECAHVWSPMTKKPSEWVNVAKLSSSYKKGSGACTIM